MNQLALGLVACDRKLKAGDGEGREHGVIPAAPSHPARHRAERPAQYRCMTDTLPSGQSAAAPLLRRGAEVAMTLLVALWACFLNLGGMNDPVSPMDEGLLLVYPELVMQGAVPHRDFWTAYGPVLFWVLGGVYSIGGVDIRLERVVAIAARVILALGMLRLLRPFGLVTAVAGALASAWMAAGFPLRAATWLFATMLLVWGLTLLLGQRGEHQRRWPTILLGGILLGLAIGVRLDTVALAAVCCGALAVASLPPGVRRFGIMGLVVGLMPTVVHINIAGPAQVIQNVLIDPVFRMPAGRRLPVPPASWLDAAKLYAIVLSIGAIAAAAVAVFRQKQGDNPWQRRVRVPVVVLGVMAVCLLPHALQRCDRNHLVLAAAMIVPLLAVAAASAFRSRAAQWAGAVVLLAVVVGAFRDIAWQPLNNVFLRIQGVPPMGVWVEANGRRLPVWGPDAAAATSSLMKAIDNHLASANPGEIQTVYVAPADLTRTNYNDTHLYHLLMPRLRPAGYYFDMNPGVNNRVGSRTVADLEAADLLILSTQWDNWTEPNASMQRGWEEPNCVAEQLFEKVNTFGPYRLYARHITQQ